MLKYSSFRSTMKYEIAPETQIIQKKKLLFFSPSIRMSGNKKKIGDKKFKKYSSRQMTFMLTKYQFPKKNHMAQISQLTISLDILISLEMLLDHYV